MKNSSTSFLLRRGALGGLRFVAAIAVALAACASVSAQDSYPNRVVRIVVPFAPGGAGDVVTRVVSQRLSGQLNQSVIVENRPGAGGAVGAAHVAKSAPDGYTLAFASVGYNLIVAMRPNSAVDPGKDLAPIGLICTQPYVLLARNDAPFKTVPELLAYAKARPGEVKLAHAGVGTLIHLFGTWLAADSGVKFNEIPYNGAGPSLNSLLAGQTDIAFDPPSTGIPQIRAGKVRAMASTGTTRMDALPEVQTLREIGYPISGSTWFGLMAPAATPKPIIDRLNKELNVALQDEEVKKRLEGMLFTVERSTPESFGKFFNDQTAVWTKIIKDNNVKASD